MEEKINLIARLLLINTKVENLRQRFKQYEYDRYDLRESGDYLTDVYERLQTDWCQVISERTEVEEKLEELVKGA